MTRRYGVICEHKAEKELIWETNPMNYEEAKARMRAIQDNPKVIRCAIFAMQFVDGNENLIPKEMEF